MNKFDEKYIIRKAHTTDIDSIMRFIEKEWKKDHIFAVNKEYFCYEHVFGEQVNFMIAIDRSTSNLEGILGYIEASQSEDCKDVWGVMWKVRDRQGNLPFLGVELMKRVMSETKCRAEIGVGANPKTSIPILKMMLGFHVGKMKHAYRLNATKNTFNIAVIHNKKIQKEREGLPNYTLIKFDSIEELNQHYALDSNKEMIPYKDAWYINRRYFNHPVYNYVVWGVQDADKVTKSLLIAREITVNNSKILRVIDYVGAPEMLSGLYDELDQLLTSNDYEYIDFYYYGIDDRYVNDAGFVLREENDENIIPNYFEPFVQQNIDIWVNSSVENVIICKGDGDQDRPNFV